MAAKSKVSPRVGPVSGRALWQALGFVNERAFQRAHRANQLAIPLYPIPGKARGVYARSDDLALFLGQQFSSPLTRSSGE